MTIISTALPFCFAGFLVSQATSVLAICFGRALAGLCIGAMSLSLPVYLAECLRPEVRGRLGLLPTTLGNLGVLICFICGAWLDWSQVRLNIIHHPYDLMQLATVAALLPLPFLAMMILVPESPTFLLVKNRLSVEINMNSKLCGNLLD